jgi:hypothetical protein
MVDTRFSDFAPKSKFATEPGQSDRELQGIQGAKASSHPMLLHEPLGLAVMHIGHADDSKLAPGNVLKKASP